MVKNATRKMNRRNKKCKLTKVQEDLKTIRQKLRGKEYSEAALEYLVREVREHFSGKISVVAAPGKCDFLKKLSSELGSSFRTLKDKKPHFGKGKILQIQKIACARDELVSVRETIRNTNGGVDKDQFIPITIALASSRAAIEIGGDPVVSLNNGCPICGSHMSD
jgi:hypothetical protein